ncbi:MAG TPA: tetratricopeptide repeat protein [Gemmatimonadaceae bacterium]|nr:tetratricopeptide repeat protein [Gemmatimonadaceae bacterium]
MRFVRSLVTVGVTMLVVGCASSGQMSAAGLKRLEQTRAARPNDAAVARNLGIAYYKAGRFADARAQLSQAAKLDPRDGTTALYLGLSAEQQKDIPGAKAAYQSYIRYGRTSRVRKQLEARLAALTRQELQLAAKNAVAQEQQLSARPGSPKTVAVMPLRFTGSDTSLQPLERGIAELLTTDLSRSHELTVVERARLQALLDEMSLQRSGQTDSTTNVRAGRIIQAGRVVNGQIAQSAGRIRIDAAIVNTQTAAVASGAASENTLDQVFAIEKAIALQLFDSLGVRLTTQERNAIEERPTRSLQAFLAYSRGLRLEDQGRYQDAARSFNDALRIDPSFGAARQKSADASAAAVGLSVTTASVEANLVGTPEGNTANQAAQGGGGSGSSASNTADYINPNNSGNTTGGATGGATGNTSAPPPDRLSSATGQESAPRNATVTIIVKVPKP